MVIGKTTYRCPADKCRFGTDNKDGIKQHCGYHSLSDFPGGELPDWPEYFSEYGED